MLLLLQTCDHQITDPQPEKPLLDIPAYGVDALPHLPANDEINNTTQAQKVVPPAYYLLQQYAQSNPEDPYAAIAGVWNSDKKRYEYEVIPLEFSAAIKRKTNGQTGYYQYVLLSAENKVYRMLAGLIPPHPQAEKLMKRWLQVEDRSLVEPISRPYAASESGTNTAADGACYIFVTGHGWTLVPCGGPLYVDGERINEPNDDFEVDDDFWGDGGDDNGWPADDSGDDGGCPASGCGGGGGPGGSDSEADAFEERIEMTELAPCMKDEMNLLTMIHEGVGSIVQDFAIDMVEPGALGNLNWEVKDGELDEYVNGITKTEYNSLSNTVTTIFDSDKAGNASDLSIARLMLHEAVHAYVISVLYNTITAPNAYEKRQELLGSDWEYAFKSHGFIVENYIDKISAGLQAFGEYMGYNVSSQYYDDLAWGGLTEYENSDGEIVTYEFFKDEITNANVRERIKNNIHAELYGTDTSGNYQNQKGEDGGC